MEIGFNKWQLAHGDVHRRIHCWIFAGGSIIVENGYVVELAEIESPNLTLWESTDPYARLSRTWRTDRRTYSSCRLAGSR